MIIEVVAAGVAAGLIAGIFGVGGGVVFVPALVLFFDFHQKTAEGTSLLAMVPVALVGAYAQHRTGFVRERAAVTIGLVSGLGGIVGALLANALPERYLQKAFSIFLLLMAFQLLRRGLSSRRERLSGVPSKEGGTGEPRQPHD
jgi:uncharacterized protein